MAAPQLRPVGIALVVYNALSILSGLGSIVLLKVMQESMAETAKTNPDMKPFADLYAMPWMGALNWIGLLLASFALVGSIFLLRRRMYGLAMAGTIVTMLNPGGACCCLFGVGLGIWGLVVLLKPEAQAAFNQP